MSDKTDRRCFLARGIAGAAGIGAAYASIEENTLQAALQDGTATTQPGKKPRTDIAPGSLPCGKVGSVTLSRLIIGGNMIGGWLHSRDLMYVSILSKTYNTEAKVFETLELAQACGINTIQFDPVSWDVIGKYNKQHTTKIQTIICIPIIENRAKMDEAIKRQVDLGATLLYPHGGMVDNHLMNGRSIDVIGQIVDLIKAQGVPAGVGGHSLEMVKICEKNKINPDFYVKTFHMDRYWSATPKERRREYDWMQPNSGDHNANNDNMWCNNPEETAEYMATIKKPWLAFKVMAAGGIPPRRAFPYAFRNGADFIFAGMFDFQIEDNVKIAIEALDQARDRKRPWRG